MRPSDRFLITPPRNLPEYLEWHREVLKEDISCIDIENEYAKVIGKIHAMFGGTLFWQDFTERQKSIGQAYRLETNFQLFGEQQFNLFTKEFCSRGFKFKVQHPVLGYWRLLKKLHRVS